MKIAILTQPLTNNYGGILQNYALQQALQRMGHDVTTLNISRKTAKRRFSTHYFLSVAKRFVQKYVKHDPSLLYIEAFRQTNFYNTPQKYQQRFLDENIKVMQVGTGPLTEENDSFEAYVVGSDQVWRPCFSPNLPNFYLDFVKNVNVKRVAYAASFGVDHWETDEVTTVKASKLAKEFDAISVRESSGIPLCKDHLGVDAIQVLDPTMLLDAEDYRTLYKKHADSNTDGEYIATYVLDGSATTSNIIKSISRQLGLPVKHLGTFSIEGFDSMESWLQGIDRAKYVITDSFHGSVFSILFRKQFVALGNKSRGMTRFEDLFSQFDLPERLVDSHEDALQSLKSPINYVKVHEQMTAKRKIANQFLESCLEI